MSKIIFSFLSFFVAALAFVGCQSNSVAPVTDNVPGSTLSKRVVENVTGSGNFFINNTLRVFTLTAKRYNDGSVDGHFNLNNHTAGVHYSGDVTVFTVVGNIVYWGGFITNSNSDVPGYGPGAGAFSAAIDNGQGQNNLPDQVTLVLSGLGLTQSDLEDYCNLGQYFVSNLADVEAGNIQIH